MFYPNMMYNSGFAPFHMGLWSGFSFLSILFWILIIVLIVKLARHSRHQSEHKSALSILRERFAKGEVSKEEFEERKRVLEVK